DIKNEVRSDSPAFLRVVGYDYNDPTGADGGHMITLVGYETYTDTEDWSNPQYALVQDNWETTGKTVYLLMGQFGSMTDIWNMKSESNFVKNRKIRVVARYIRHKMLLIFSQK